MAGAPDKKAFTLIELLVVIAIIALLISILLPSLQGAREQGKKAVCLANMRSIAQASHSYAGDDETEQLIPIMWMKIRKDHQYGFSTVHSWRTALPTAYGGRTPQTEFLGIATPDILMNDWYWGAARRPLNKYVYGAVSESDFANMPLYRCPADTGYPSLGDRSEWGGEDSIDWPEAVEYVPCYDFLGNSYRLNPCGAVWLQGTSLAKATLSVGADGHKATNIDNPSRVAMYCEPLFYFWSRQDPGSTPDPDVLMFPGWHKRIMSDNVAYCDGSARTTRVEALAEFTDELLDDMGIGDYWKDKWHYWLRRGRTWQTDSYRAPGAFVAVYNKDGTALMTPDDLSGPNYTGWPFDGMTVNLPPD